MLIRFAELICEYLSPIWDSFSNFRKCWSKPFATLIFHHSNRSVVFWNRSELFSYNPLNDIRHFHSGVTICFPRCDDRDWIGNIDYHNPSILLVYPSLDEFLTSCKHDLIKIVRQTIDSDGINWKLMLPTKYLGIDTDSPISIYFNHYDQPLLVDTSFFMCYHLFPRLLANEPFLPNRSQPILSTFNSLIKSIHVPSFFDEIVFTS